MTTHKGLLLTEAKGKLTLGSVNRPSLEKGEVLVKNVACAVNPVDWKQIEYNFWIPTLPYINGCDIAGTIEEVGEGVTNVKKGDRVFAYTGVNRPLKNGGYQEYTVVPGDLIGKIPHHVSFEEAASLGLGTITSGVALFHDLQIPFGGPPPTDTILIWGAASSVGAYGVQLARLAGFTNILAVCSPKNFDYVKSLGATHFFDYHASDIVQQIKTASHNKLSLAYDTVGATATIIAALGEHGGNVATALGNSIPKELPPNVKAKAVFAGVIHNNPEGAIIGKRLYQYVEAWLISKSYQPNNITHVPNGFGGIPEAHQQMKSGQVSASKLVCKVSETPGL